MRNRDSARMPELIIHPISVISHFFLIRMTWGSWGIQAVQEHTLYGPTVSLMCMFLPREKVTNVIFSVKTLNISSLARRSKVSDWGYLTVWYYYFILSENTSASVLQRPSMENNLKIRVKWFYFIWFCPSRKPAVLMLCFYAPPQPTASFFYGLRIPANNNPYKSFWPPLPKSRALFSSAASMKHKSVS